MLGVVWKRWIVCSDPEKESDSILYRVKTYLIGSGLESNGELMGAGGRVGSAEMLALALKRSLIVLHSIRLK